MYQKNLTQLKAAPPVPHLNIKEKKRERLENKN